VKLDKKALQLVNQAIDDEAEENGESAESADSAKIFVEELIKIYLSELKANNLKLALLDLANTRNGMMTIIQACNTAITELERAAPESHNRALYDSFTHYLKVIAVQADAHYAGHIN
jgi:hypothetical protein